MRVFHLASEYPPQQVFGLGRAVHDLAVAEAELGEEVHVVTNSIGGRDKEVEDKGVNIHRIAFPPPPKPPDEIMGVIQFNVSVLETSLQTAAETREPTVIHVHDWLTVHSGRALSWLYPEARLIVTIHDTTVGKHFGKLNATQQYCANVERWAGELADVVICCSEYVKQEMVRYYQTPAEKIVVIPCGVDPQRFTVSGDLTNWRQTFAGPDEQLVSYVGRLDHEKGLDHLLEAMSRVMAVADGVRLVLAGKGRLQQKMQEDAVRLEIADRVEFAGYVAGKALAALYRCSDVVVIPSLYEPFGLVALEAMICGAPVIVSDIGGLREITGDEQIAVRVPSANVEALAEAITGLLSEPECATKLSEAGREYVLANYSWPDVAARTIETYVGAG